MAKRTYYVQYDDEPKRFSGRQGNLDATSDEDALQIATDHLKRVGVRSGIVFRYDEDRPRAPHKRIGSVTATD